jgi:uracil-DNA glycosylase family 4
MIVLHAPEASDQYRGAIANGNKGAFMRKHLARKFNAEDIYITSLVKCYPGKNGKADADPPKYALDQCQKWLDMEIGVVNPDLLVAVGAFVQRGLGIKGGIRKNAGKIFDSDFGIPTLVIPNPGSLMLPKTRPEDIMAFVASLDAIKTFMAGGIERVEFDEFADMEEPLGFDVETADVDGFPTLDPKPEGSDIWSTGISGRHARFATTDNEYAADLMEDKVVAGWHMKFDLRWRRDKMNIPVPPPEGYEDGQMLAHIMGLRPMNLKDLSAIYIGGENTKFKDVVKKGVKFEDKAEEVLDYNADDAWKARVMVDILKPQVYENGWGHVYEFDKAFMPVLMEMEDRGLPVSSERMVLWRDQLKVEWEDDLEVLADAGITEPTKNAAIAEKFWKGKPKVVTTKQGLSTAAGDLDEYASEEQRPWVDALIRWRQKTKFVSTYLDNWIEMAKHDGRLHPTFNQTATATARPSTSDPNLANVTKSLLFQMFVAPEGYSFISCDQSQVELRAGGNITGDRALIEAYLNGMDMHDLTAAMYQVKYAAKKAYDLIDGKKDPFDEFTRTFAKRVNFGILYGITKWGLSKMLKCSEEDAQAIIDAFYEKFPGVADWQTDMKNLAERQLWIPDDYGRPLWTPGMAAESGMLRMRGEKQTSNYPLQATAAHEMKKAMMAAREYLVNWVYDEVLFLVPDKHVKDYSEFLSEALVMRDREIPYTIDMKIGKTWGDLKKIPEFDPAEFAA